ncbi:hypothetical protein [Rubinisphaera italica]|uniref:Uncharacterized protein n=1 Tax=Rubinisphaera italica TaxID=2527969 RepID=A0A5C5XM51_9PLAN|nr:hypothetical protein [Rubinisphaera italica]TWT63195.1 hypothetical protein Pan54_39480 [Rubinisphaera italica]
MQVFYDDLKRQWRIQINVGTLKKVRRVFSEDGKPFDLLDPHLPTRLANDPALFVDLLWELVDKTQNPGVTPEQFAEGLGGDGLEAASEAFIEELFDFFPKARRDLNRAIYANVKREQDRIITETIQQINNLPINGEKTSSSDVTSSPESSE